LGWQTRATMPSYWLGWNLTNFSPRLVSNHDPRDLGPASS
jgi:hypothetical protein